MLGYPPRYTKEQRKRKAYCNAFDAIYYYGIERKDWNYKTFNLCRREMKEIWAVAYADAHGKSKYDYIWEEKWTRTKEKQFVF